MNKQELFTLFSGTIALTAWPEGKLVFITSGITVVNTDTSHSMLPCNHEEADTRIQIHLLDALEHGCSTCLVLTMDTDVVGKFHAQISSCRHPGLFWHWQDLNLSSYEYHLPCSEQSLQHCLPLLHRWCCDTSALCGKGKKPAWVACISSPVVTQAFNCMAANPYTFVTFEYWEIMVGVALHLSNPSLMGIAQHILTGINSHVLSWYWQ